MLAGKWSSPQTEFTKKVRVREASPIVEILSESVIPRGSESNGGYGHPAPAPPHGLAGSSILGGLDGRGGNGLFLNVKPTANGRLSKSWVQRIRVANQVTHIGLGGYPIVTLAGARKKAVENRCTIAKGLGPRGGGIPTFREGLEKALELQRPNWRSPKSEKQWRSSLDAYAQELQHKRVSRIHSGDVMDVLRPIWNTKRETARRVARQAG